MNPQAHNPLSIMPSFASRLNDDQMNADDRFLKQFIDEKSNAFACRSDRSSKLKAQGSCSVLPIAACGVQSTGIIGDNEHGAFYSISPVSCAMGRMGILRHQGF